MDSNRRLLPGDPTTQWLSVTEAVTYCARRGLHRNIKTIRRWAERSLKRPEDAEVKVREQDTGFGFRYMIDRESLDLKIAQELEFEAKQNRADTPGHGQSGPEMRAAVRDAAEPLNDGKTGAGMLGHVQTDPDTSGNARRLEVTSIGDDFLKEQVKEKDRQIGELNKQLERKDDQIMTMLERDRETNILIRGLQNTVANILQLKAPKPNEKRHDIHDEPEDDPRITVYSEDSGDEPATDPTRVNPVAVDNSDEGDRGVGVY